MKLPVPNSHAGLRSDALKLSAALLLSGGLWQAQAAFQAVETFNALSAGNIGGQNGWVVTSGSTGVTVTSDPDNVANRVLQLTGDPDAYKALPAPIADASGGTIFFRVRVTDLANDVSFGLSDVAAPTLGNFPDYEVQGNATNTDGRFGTRDGGANQSPLFNMTAGVWYNVWYVVNTTTDTFTLHVQSSGHAAYNTQTQINAPDGTWNFRNSATTTQATALTTFLIMSNNGNTGLLVDDIYVDTATTPNLTNPVPSGAVDSEPDGLLDDWEVFYFSHLGENGAGDPDSDTFTNEQEETAGSNPTITASTPVDIDGDGLLDTWEVTHFGNRTAQNGAGDADGDGVTNEQEETAGTNPMNAASAPDTDNDGLRDVWELAHWETLLVQSGSGDPDGDGFTNAQEMAAGSDPKDINWRPNKSVLKHRWSFNSDLTDGVGTANATIVDPDNNAAAGGTVSVDTTSVTLTGGASGTSAAVLLGTDLLNGVTHPVTIELWATQNAVQNWGRIFDFGSGTTEYLFMSFTRGTDLANDQVEWVDNGVATNRSTLPVNSTAQSYALGTPYHVVLTLTPAAYTNGALATGTRVTWYIATSTTTTTLSAKGTFDTANNLANFAATNYWLGRSMWTGDNVAAASYDEFRIWKGALTANEINTYQLSGPNAFSFVDTDSDGLSDPWEEAYFDGLGQNGSGDPDNDTFNNAQEYAAGSDPTVTESVPGDVDGDGLPDSWEIDNFNGLAQGPDGDPDGDGATNLQEYEARFHPDFGESTDPNDDTSYPDVDFDGMNDAWELLHFGNLLAEPNEDADDDGSTNLQEYTFGFDPNNYLSSLDSDSDGLPDGWEIHYFRLGGETGLANGGTIIARHDGNADPDSDQFSNALEYAFLTDPNSSGSVPGDLDGNGTNDGPLLKLGGDLIGTTSFNAALNWHDAAIPVAGKTYIVAVNGLRTPTTGDVTFAGDRLVLTTSGTNIGTLIWKTPGAVTLPLLDMRGGRINQAIDAGTLATLNGAIVVNADSELFANNGSFLINSTISGPGGLTLTGNNLVTLAGASTRTGNLVVNAATTATTNRFTLAPTGSMTFVPKAAGVTNAITGAGVITLNGTFNIDASGASSTIGDSWTLVATTGAKTYGASFNVAGYGGIGTTPGSRQWTSTGSAPFFRFDEATGVLTVIADPDTDDDNLADEWEMTHFETLARDGTGDFDNDLATDAEEYAAGSNPDSDASWPDSDADGVNDAWEIATFGNLTTATVTDKDGDALLDTWEETYFGTIGAQNGSGDPDNDTFTNEVEETAGSDPTLAASTPTDINADGFADGSRLLVTDAFGTSSFNSGLNWQGATVPAAGLNFLVNINSLRTPADATPYTFAGDRLVIYIGGNLLVKGSGVLTSPGNLILDGGSLHNGTDGNVVVTVEGSIPVTRASTINAQNNGFIFNAALSGSGNLNLIGGSMVTFAGNNTRRGSLNLGNTAGFTLAQTGTMTFVPGVSGVTNAITGTNPAILNGTFVIDTSVASTAAGSSWTLVATTGAKTYGATFNVSGFTSDGAAAGTRKWTKGNYQFDEATGILSVIGGLSALDSWRVTHFGSAGAAEAANTADPDNDGRPNLLEYATGTLPTAADSGSAATVARSGNFLTLSFNHIGDASLSYVVEASNDLATWTTAQTYTGLTAAGTTTYTDTVSLTAGTRRFLRLKIVAP